MIRPTVGRVVWFYRHGRQQQDQPHSAIVAYVHGDRCVNLTWFDHDGFAHNATSVTLRQEGDEEPTGQFCEWMPYQIGQAKKA